MVQGMPVPSNLIELPEYRRSTPSSFQRDPPPGRRENTGTLVGDIAAKIMKSI